MAPVDGAVTRPSPTAIITMEARTGPKYALSLPRVEATKKPAPISIKPAGTTILVPRRRAKIGAAGAAAPTPRAKGSVRRPAEKGAIAVDELEVLGDQEDKAEQAEERDGDREAGGAEADVAEQGDVEHRLADAALPGSENRQQGDAGAVAGQGDWSRPAVRRRLDCRVDNRRHSGDRQDEADQVQPRAAGSRLVGTSHAPSARASTAMGMVAKKTELQEKCW